MTAIVDGSGCERGVRPGRVEGGWTLVSLLGWGLLALSACGGSDSLSGPGEEVAGVRIDPVTGFHFGVNDYTEWHPGTLPIIISSPHGGGLEPDEIPDRTFGVTVTDLRTREVTLALEAAIEARLGARPHVVISNLRRTKLDPNREIFEAAQESPPAERAWREYHAFIDSASAEVEALRGGIYIDMHGHGHAIQRIELGYLYNDIILFRSDSLIDDLDGEDSSILALAERTEIPFSELLRGEESIGGLLEARGYPAVPSPTFPNAGGEPFFSGGFSTVRHGSREGGQVDGVQFELNWEGVRDSAANRAAFAAALAELLELWIALHYTTSSGVTTR